MSGIRLDKWLWAARFFKTRSLATDAIKREQVRINDRVVKPSAEVKVGNMIALREPPIWRSWEIIAIPSSRVGAKLVPDLIRETTSFGDLEKRELARLARTEHRDPGDGRPTKRDRRDMERFTQD